MFILFFESNCYIIPKKQIKVIIENIKQGMLKQTLRKEFKMEYKNKKLEEFNNYIRFRKIAIIGLGVSNIPLIDYLMRKKQQ